MDKIQGPISLIERWGFVFSGCKKEVYRILKRHCQFMAKNDDSWFLEDNSWRKTTCHEGGLSDIKFFKY